MVLQTTFGSMSVKSINAAGTLISFETPKVMGILNVTPDSFYNKGTESSPEDILAKAEKMLKQGAEILDVGGMSTRPKTEIINADEELVRVIPVIKSLKSKYPQAIISIDTYRAKVAEEAINAGATIVNDVSGGDMDEDMYRTVAKHNAIYICMHMQGTPETMQDKPRYDNVVTEIYQKLQAKLMSCREAGITDVILDVGFGFGKTLQHNYSLLNNLNYFQALDCPILVGLSRKSMIYKLLDTTPEEALNGTSVANTISLMNGANIIRVHDVKEAVESVQIYTATKKL